MLGRRRCSFFLWKDCTVFYCSNWKILAQIRSFQETISEIFFLNIRQVLRLVVVTSATNTCLSATNGERSRRFRRLSKDWRLPTSKFLLTSRTLVSCCLFAMFSFILAPPPCICYCFIDVPIMEGMACVVDQAAVVLLCVTHRYKESPSCRAGSSTDL